MKRSLKLAVSFIILLSAFSASASLSTDPEQRRGISFQLSAVHADTIRTTDNRELKGIVVEDYKDRVVLSTVEGEVTILKSKINELAFDSEEDNLIKLAERSRDRGDYERSYAYYAMAEKINPRSKAAKDGMIFLQGYLFRKEEARKEEDVKRRGAIEEYGTLAQTKVSEEDELKEGATGLKERLGITLDIKDGFPEIESVVGDSAAYEAGLRKGDLLISVWGKLTGYMSLKEVTAILLEKAALELKCVIERNISVNMNGAGGIGASFAMELDGLTVSNVKEPGPSFAAGLEKGDLITAIDGRPTRYMPLKEALELINNSKKDVIKLTLRRELMLWRR